MLHPDVCSPVIKKGVDVGFYKEQQERISLSVLSVSLFLNQISEGIYLFIYYNAPFLHSLNSYVSDSQGLNASRLYNTYLYNAVSN